MGIVYPDGIIEHSMILYNIDTFLSDKGENKVKKKKVSFHKVIWKY